MLLRTSTTATALTPMMLLLISLVFDVGHIYAAGPLAPRSSLMRPSCGITLITATVSLLSATCAVPTASLDYGIRFDVSSANLTVGIRHARRRVYHAYRHVRSLEANLSPRIATRALATRVQAGYCCAMTVRIVMGR